MTITLWGTRGSLAAPGSETARYGGNTSCVEVRGRDGTVLVLDAGTGIRRLGKSLPTNLRRLDLLLTHLHMDHIQGLGFFAPLHNPDLDVHIWGPASTTANLRTRLMRYLSPPLFPVHLRDLPCRLTLHEVPCGDFSIGEFLVTTALVCHPGPTVAYRISTAHGACAYFPDHEPALGVPRFPMSGDWTSGYALAADVDLLIHDAQYSSDEYAQHVGWGHSAVDDALKFAALSRVKQLVPFHHDPAHTDDDLDRMVAAAQAATPAFTIRPGTEGAVFEVG
ncbi:MAG TPA: MBL fold metallo-hydrolase [Candidatus Margulisiibacteriota bacterium]|nr:MBL fold metallo-hydrolase [Candidatus Margulisiibacteriota bacterium]